jgi:biopolymer transport protein ExbD
MAFGSFNPQRQQSMLSDINVTPMVDVMLVLLVIFIMTAPMLTQAVKLALPAAAAQQGMALAACARPRPELQLRADKNTRYEIVAQVMAAAQARGLTDISFITEPDKEKKDGQR